MSCTELYCPRHQLLRGQAGHALKWLVLQELAALEAEADAMALQEQQQQQQHNSVAMSKVPDYDTSGFPVSLEDDSADKAMVSP